jgi:Ribonuclease G/E
MIAPAVCPRCQGEGLVYSSRERYDLALEGWLDDPLEDPCPECLGEGVIARVLEPELERAA